MSNTKSYIVPILPTPVEVKLNELTGYFDPTVSYDEWMEKVDQIFAQYHGIVTDNEYVFESEAHYYWMVLALS